MNKLIDYLRGLITDANLATAPLQARHAGVAWATDRSFDHPTYLRRGLVIAGLGAGSPPRGHAPRAGLPGCHASR